MKNIDKCRLCCEIKELSFEHIPPESAFNSTPVYFQKSIHLHDKNSYLYGKKIRSNRGGVGSICVSLVIINLEAGMGQTMPNSQIWACT